MLSKVVFENGKYVSREFLEEVQKGDSLNSNSPREDFYDAPSPSDHAGWNIGERDGVKDWEISDPSQESETNIGRLAHDGVVLNNYNPSTLAKVWGPPALRESSVGSGVFGVWVNGGKIISTEGVPMEWPIQFVQLVDVDSPNYIYIDEKLALENIAESDPVQLSIAPALPSVSLAHIPLAKITPAPGGTSLLVGEDGKVAGAGYVDLRPNVFVGNLNTYPKTLINTDIKSSSYVASVWERVIANTTSGSIVIETPLDPTDSDRFAIVDIAGTFNEFPIVLRPSQDQEINGSTDDWVINVKDSHVQLFWHEETNQWKFEDAPGAECSPTLGTFLGCGGSELIGIRTAEECPDGQPLPATYPNPSQGVYSYEVSSGKCFRTYAEGVALYSDGEGQVIPVSNAKRCAKDGPSYSSAETKNVIYVDHNGDDSLDNRGTNPDRPFRTPERAFIEGLRESRRGGGFRDRFDRILIKLAPGDYYLDNSRGYNSIPGLTSSAGLVQRINTSFSVVSKVTSETEPNLPSSSIVITINSLDTASTQPPIAFNLGRTLYSESGGVGTIVRIQKRSSVSALWDVTLDYLRGTWNVNDEIFYDNLSIINPTTGGVIIPRGISFDGENLRKVRIHPMYVPELNPVENEAQTEKTAIFKVTGGSYTSEMTFTDNLQFARTHNTVTAVAFASEDEIFGGGGEVSYYSKINSLFADFDGWGGDGIEPIAGETTIVAPVAGSKSLRHVDVEENLTGAALGDSRAGAPVSYPGAARLVFTGSGDSTPFDLPDINSARSSSPYVYNCSVRSIFGMNGLDADGSRVAGFKSMVTANFTQVSLQVDPNCYVEETYFLDPPTELGMGLGKRYRVSSADEDKYRHFGFRAINDGFIQIVSCFVIGNADHFVAENGGDLSITNSCSDFGDISLKAKGFKSKSFSQDEGVPGDTYDGTRLLEIIPPLPLSYSALPGGIDATLQDGEVNTGLVLDLEKTQEYILDNKLAGDLAPVTMRYYVQNSDSSKPFTLSFPPSAASAALGQYTYTTKLPSDEYELSGGPSRVNRKRLYVTGFDENGNSILYAANLEVAPDGGPGWSSLDDASKVFIWDSAQSAWYINVNTTGIVEETTDLDGDGFLLKKFDRAFQYKLLTSPDPSETIFAGIDFVFDGSTVKIIRANDRRSNAERVYKVVLDGFLKSEGIRRPQEFYIVEKQVSEAGFPLNNSSALRNNPLTISEITQYDKYFNPDISGTPPNPGKYVAVLSQASESRKVITGNYFPAINFDNPEETEDPEESITKQSLELLLDQPGVYFNDDLEPSVATIEVKTAVESTEDGFLIGLRRPSIIRASGHTWEWAGYLNYDTALPIFQGDPLSKDSALGKILAEQAGGRVYATGMDEEGKFFIGTTVFDLRSGQQSNFADDEDLSQTNQVFNGVVIRNSLVLQDGADTVFGNNTDIFFSNTTRFRSLTSGDIVASASPPAVYATSSRAGLVQFASTEDIRGALGSGVSGVADKLAVSAAQLAAELTARFDNAVVGGTGITVTSEEIELPGGDPGENADNVTRYIISANAESDFGGYVPIGGIIMWNGITIPTNYRLCNGANGTPDLRNRFVVGTGTSYALGATGGNASITLSVANLPSHNHGGTVTTSTNGDHNHTGTAESSGAHTHAITDSGHTHNATFASVGAPGADNTGGSNFSIQNVTQATASATTGISIVSGGAHTHNLSVDTNGAHTHTITVGAQGGGEAFDNRPPYYALAFIQRVA